MPCPVARRNCSGKGRTPLKVPHEGIGSSLFADCGGRAVAGKDRGLVRELQQRLADRAHLLIERTAPQIRAADASLEKRIAAEESRVVARQVKRHATGRVAGGVQDFELDRACAQLIAGVRNWSTSTAFGGRTPNQAACSARLW